MSHCNITLPRDRDWDFFRKIAVLEAEKSILESRLRDVESNLESIFDRIKRGEEVYLDYRDGSRIYIQARPEEDEAKR